MRLTWKALILCRIKRSARNAHLFGVHIVKVLGRAGIKCRKVLVPQIIANTAGSADIPYSGRPGRDPPLERMHSPFPVRWDLWRGGLFCGELRLFWIKAIYELIAALFEIARAPLVF